MHAHMLLGVAVEPLPYGILSPLPTAPCGHMPTWSLRFRLLGCVHIGAVPSYWCCYISTAQELVFNSTSWTAAGTREGRSKVTRAEIRAVLSHYLVLSSSSFLACPCASMLIVSTTKNLQWHAREQDQRTRAAGGNMGTTGNSGLHNTAQDNLQDKPCDEFTEQRLRRELREDPLHPALTSLGVLYFARLAEGKHLV